MKLVSCVLVSAISLTSSSGSVDGKKLGRVTLLVPTSPTPKSSTFVVDALIISVFIVDSSTASASDSVIIVGLVSDGEVGVIEDVGLGVVVEAKVNRFGRKTPAKPVEIVRPVVNCELVGNVIVFVVCVGGAVVGANVKKFGRNIPEKPVDMVLPVVMSVASLPSVLVVVVLVVIRAAAAVVVVEVVEVKVVLVVVDSRLIPKSSSKSVPDTKTFSVVVPELSKANPNSSSSITELF